jgi:hypothetical protein
MAQGMAVAAPYFSHMIGVDLSGSNATDWTSGAVIVGVVLTALALALAFPAVHLALDMRDERAAGGLPRLRDLIPSCLTAGLLAVVAILPAYGAARIFWAAQRGDYRPYASVRADARRYCENSASGEGLTGTPKQQQVDKCVDQMVAEAAADD